MTRMPLSRWWEIFEMTRKLMLSGVIILIQPDASGKGKQIAFAVLISTFCLFVSLRTDPYVDAKLGKLYNMVSNPHPPFQD